MKNIKKLILISIILISSLLVPKTANAEDFDPIWPVPIYGNKVSHMDRYYGSWNYSRHSDWARNEDYGLPSGAIDISNYPNGSAGVAKKDVVAIEDGNVIYASTTSNGTKLVKIKHSNGKTSYYAHLDSIKVGKGPVNKGEKIGTVGETGKAYGEHLHFEIINENGIGDYAIDYYKEKYIDFIRYSDSIPYGKDYSNGNSDNIRNWIEAHYKLEGGVYVYDDAKPFKAADEVPAYSKQAIPDGVYKIKNKANGLMINVDYGIDKDGTPINTYNNYDTDDEQFRFEHIGDGKYYVYAMCSSDGKNRVLDVYRGNNSLGYGQKFDIYVRNDAPAQILRAVPVGDGNDFVFELASTKNHVMAADGMSPASLVILKYYDNSDSKQIWNLCDNDGKTIDFSDINVVDTPNTTEKYVPNGIFTLVNVGTGRNMDIAGASDSNGASAILYDKNGTSAQQFRIEYVDDGSYYIYAICSSNGTDKVLDVATGGNNIAKGQMIDIYRKDNDNKDDQLFKIVHIGSNRFVIEAAALENVVLTPDSNLRLKLGNYTQSDDQKWTLCNADGIEVDIASATDMVPVPTQKRQTIPDGIYTFKSKAAELMLNVKDGQDSNGNPVNLIGYDGSENQRFKVKHQGNGKYYIGAVASSNGDNRVLDVAKTGSTLIHGQLMDIYDRNNEDEQLFYIAPDGNGTYIIELASVKDLVVAADGLIDNSTVKLKAYDYTNFAHKWIICDTSGKAFDPVKDIVADTVATKTERTIPDGIYTFRNCENDLAMDIRAAGDYNGCPVTAFPFNATSAQRYRVVYISNGKYTLSPICSQNGEARAVSINKTESSVMHGDSLYLYDNSKSTNQLFYIVPNSDGSYIIESAAVDNHVISADITNKISQLAIKKYNKSNKLYRWKICDDDGKQIDFSKPVVPVSLYESRVNQIIADFNNTTFYPADTSNTYYPWQCTWYAAGRAYEKTNTTTIGHLGNANEWYSGALALGHKVGNELKSNSIACFDSTASSPAGHVIFIEMVDGDTVYYTEGNDEGSLDNDQSYNDGRLKKGTVTNFTSRSNYQGCMYLGDAVEITVDPIDTQYKKTLPDGIYTFKNKNSNKMLNISHGTDKNETPAIIYKSDGSKEQQFRIQHVENGKYYIYAMCSSDGNNRVLDVYRGNAPVQHGNLIDIYDRNDLPAQLFYIVPTENYGEYIFELASLKDHAITASGADDGSRLCLRRYNNSDNNYRWIACDTEGKSVGDVQNADVTPVQHSRTVADGVYTIKNKASARMLNVSYGYDYNAAPIIIYDEDNSTEQKFRFEHYKDGKYYIYAMCSSDGENRVLDILRGNDDPRDGDRVDIYDKNDEQAQLFYIVPLGNGDYLIELASKENYVIAPSGTQNGSKMYLRKYDETDSSHKWRLYSDNDKEIIAGDSTTNSQKTPAVPDGVYTFKNKDSGKMLNVRYGDDYNTAPIILYQFDGTVDQRFKVKHIGGGKYNIFAMCSSDGTNRVVDVLRNGETPKEGHEFDIYDKNDSVAQEFYINPVGDGDYVIELVSTKNMVMSSDGTDNGSKVMLRSYDKSNNAQKWRICDADENDQVTKDTNSDGVVDLLDLVVAAKSQSSNILKADQNGDGLINMYDLIIIARDNNATKLSSNAYSIIDTYTIYGKKYYKAKLTQDINGVKSGSEIYLNINKNVVTDKEKLEKLDLIHFVDFMGEVSIGVMESKKDSVTINYNVASEWNSSNIILNKVGSLSAAILSIMTVPNTKVVLDVATEQVDPDLVATTLVMSILEDYTNKTITNADLAISLMGKDITDYSQALKAYEAMEQTYANHAAAIHIASPTVNEVANIENLTLTYALELASGFIDTIVSAVDPNSKLLSLVDGIEIGITGYELRQDLGCIDAYDNGVKKVARIYKPYADFSNQLKVK